MTIRNLGFLLVGLGTGLLLSFFAVLQVTRWMHHMFLFEVHWQAYVWMAMPWVLLAGGIAMLRSRRPE